MRADRDARSSSDDEARAVVAVLRELPGVRGDEGTQAALEGIAAAVAALEPLDADARALRVAELRAAGVPEHVVVGAELLVRERWETHLGYWRRVDGFPDLVRIIAVARVVARLRAAPTGAAGAHACMSRGASRGRREEHAVPVGLVARARAATARQTRAGDGRCCGGGARLRHGPALSRDELLAEVVAPVDAAEGGPLEATHGTIPGCDRVREIPIHRTRTDDGTWERARRIAGRRN